MLISGKMLRVVNEAHASRFHLSLPISQELCMLMKYKTIFNELDACIHGLRTCLNIQFFPALFWNWNYSGNYKEGVSMYDPC